MKCTNRIKICKTLVATLFILNQQSVEASWCNGSQYMLFEMPLSKRLIQASEAIQQASTNLTVQSAQLKLDYENQNIQTLQQIERQINLLSQQTIGLCELSEDAEYPLNTSSVVFNNDAELRARLLLNLGLLTAQQEARQEILQQQKQLKALSSTLQTRQNTLAVLHNEWNLKRSVMRPVTAQQFIQSACLAVTDSDDLLDQVQSITHNQLVAEKINLQRNSPISEQRLAEFMDNCELDPSNTGWANQLMNKLKGWF